MEQGTGAGGWEGLERAVEGWEALVRAVEGWEALGKEAGEMEGWG